MDAAQGRVKVLIDEIGRSVVGQQPLVEGLLVALLCGGHALVVQVENPPRPDQDEHHQHQPAEQVGAVAGGGGDPALVLVAVAQEPELTQEPRAEQPESRQDVERHVHGESQHHQG